MFVTGKHWYAVTSATKVTIYKRQSYVQNKTVLCMKPTSGNL